MRRLALKHCIPSDIVLGNNNVCDIRNVVASALFAFCLWMDTIFYLFLQDKEIWRVLFWVCHWFDSCFVYLNVYCGYKRSV